MINSKSNNLFLEKKSIHSQSQVEYCDEIYPFNAVFENVKEQIEFKCFSANVRDAAEDICLIIAEVLKLPPNTLVRIAGNNLPAEMVQAIYCRLTHEHVELVIENFGRATYEIKHKKTYLRTALYNSAFEFNAHYENAVHKDFPELVNRPFGTRRNDGI